MKYRLLIPAILIANISLLAPQAFANPCDQFLASETPEEIQARQQINQSVADTAEKLQAKGIVIEIATLKGGFQKLVITPVESGDPMNKLAWALRSSDFPISLECSPEGIRKSDPTGNTAGYFSVTNRSINLAPFYMLSAANDFGGNGASVLLHEVEHWARAQTFARGKDQLLNSRIQDGRKTANPNNAIYSGSFSLDELKTYTGDLYRASKTSEIQQRNNPEAPLFEMPSHRAALIKDFCERLDQEVAREYSLRVANQRWGFKNLFQDEIALVKDKRTKAIYKLAHDDIAVVMSMFPQLGGYQSLSKNVAARILVDEVERMKLQMLQSMSDELKEWANRVSFFLKSGPVYNENVKLDLFQAPRKIVLKYEEKWTQYLNGFSARPEVMDPK